MTAMYDPPEPSSSRRIGKGMIVAAWILALTLLTFLFSGFLDRQRNPNQQLVSRISEDGIPEVALKRNRYGHYLATGHINGQPVRFLLDTGASDVVIPGPLAEQLKLRRGLPVAYQTANGTITGYRTLLDSVGLGPLHLKQVPASINPYFQSDDILLGMSVLKHLEFTQRGDTLTLRPLN
jgi:aspartyl protease family protein